MSTGNITDDIMRKIREKEAANKGKKKPTIKKPKSKEVDEKDTKLVTKEDVKEVIKEPEPEIVEPVKPEPVEPEVTETDSVDPDEVVKRPVKGGKVHVSTKDEEITTVGVAKEHPKYERVVTDVEEQQKLAPEEIVFRDVFKNVSGQIKYNSDHEKSGVRNLSKAVINQVTDDLRNGQLNVQVSMGANYYIIKEDNMVLKSPTSLVRYLLLNGIGNDDLSLQLARQLFLEKHPDGESKDFDHGLVRTDERDVYAMLLSTKADPERNIMEQLEEMVRLIRDNDEALAKSNEKILKNTLISNNLLNGINMASSLLVLERMGLTEGNLPKSLGETRGFITQDTVINFSDQLTNEISLDVMQRKKLIERNKRSENGQRGRVSRRNRRR